MQGTTTAVALANKGRKGSASVLLRALTLIFTLPALAQSDNAPKVEFKIESQPMETALTALGAQSGLTIIVETKVSKGVRAQALSGSYTAEEALKKLLEPAGLKADYLDNKTVAIRLATSTALSREGRGSEGDLDAGTLRLAQNTGTSDTTPNEEPKESLQEVVVTGTHIRGVTPVGSPVFVYDRERIERSGVGSVRELVETIPQNFSADGADTNVGFGVPNNNQAASAVNLRGIGTAGTLVLLNGHRLAPSLLGEFVDVSAIPLAAVERVEVLPDGASAIYGSDAVAGVVNFVMRRNYEGAETRIRNGWLSASDARDLNVNHAFGHSWTSGNVFASASYQHRDELDARDRDYDQVFTPYHLEPEKQTASLLAAVSQDLTDHSRLHLDAFYSKMHSNQLVTGEFFPTLRAVIKPVQYSANAGMQFDHGNGWMTEGRVSHANSSWDRDTFEPNFGHQTEAYRSQINTAELKLSGAAFAAPGGRAAFATGIGARTEKYRRRSSLNALFGFAGTNSFNRDVATAFGELSLPLVGTQDGRAWARSLSLSLAARYEDYTDAGNTVDPKIGFLWQPTASLGLRASYGTSFNTARFIQTATTFNTLVILELPGASCPANTCLTLWDAGNREEYRPETSESFSVGIELTPPALPGFKASAGFYDIRYEDRIGDLPSPADVLANAGEFGSLVTANPSETVTQELLAECIQPLRCANLVGDFDPSAVDYYLDLRTTNLATTHANGLDLNINYSWQALAGEWFVDFSGTHALKFESQLTTISAPFEGIDRVGLPAATRLRGGVGYSAAAFSLNGFVNYVNAYTNNRVVPNRPVESWTTVDLRLLLPLEHLVGWPGADLSLAVQNLFDSDPPRVIDAGTLLGFDPTNSNPDGRVMALELVKRWEH
jgi:iron complex outermembrane recepter protein